jgi:hypothetical protein
MASTRYCEECYKLVKAHQNLVDRHVELMKSQNKLIRHSLDTSEVESILADLENLIAAARKAFVAHRTIAHGS